MSVLQDIGFQSDTDKASYHQYLDFYEKNLPDRKFKGRLLEIGILQGASIKMWHEYYPNAEIVGVDIDHRHAIDVPGAKMLVADATKSYDVEPLGMFDIIIDDGSHFTADQQDSFNLLYYKQLNKGGYYIIEDLHTSLLPQYINSERTTIEFLEDLGIKVLYFRRQEDLVDSMTCIIRAGQ